MPALLYIAILFGAFLACALRVVRVRDERLPWALFAAALFALACAEVIWDVAYDAGETAPYPSWADALWLTFYPLVYAGLTLLVRRRMYGFRASQWLDGLIAAFVTATFGSLFLVDPVMDATGGSWAVVATTAAYPVFDVVLVGILLCLYAGAGWRPGAGCHLLAAAMVTTAIADVAFNLKSAAGTWVDGSFWDHLYPTSAVLLAAAAWLPTPARRKIDFTGRRVFAVPALFGVAALGLTAYGFNADFERHAVLLTLLSLVTIFARAALTFRENLALLGSAHHEARTDPLTGLANRRQLMEDLDRVFESGQPRWLLMLDLDGFKLYNDTFGHPAGDALLTRLAGRLDDAVSDSGRAYRLGGDEFCVLAPAGDGDHEELCTVAALALQERGEGFAIGSSQGAVAIPDDAHNTARALQVADHRLYGQKSTRPSSAAGQAREVLLGLLRERDPEREAAIRQLRDLSIAVGRRVGLKCDQLGALARVAEFHDLGELALPADLAHQSSLVDGADADLVRRLPLVAERILGSAPALQNVAGAVRGMYERFDGTGYPDGLAGEAIPLAARIVSACAAYEGMTSGRTHLPPLDDERARWELERLAGTRFDPQIVRVLYVVTADRSVDPTSVRGMSPTHGEVTPAAL